MMDHSLVCNAWFLLSFLKTDPFREILLKNLIGNSLYKKRKLY